jgi:hypothetical protein
MSKAKIIKGLLSLFQKKADPKAVKKLDIGPPRDPGVDYETAAALKKSRKIFDAQQKNLNPLQDELDRMLALEKANLDESLNKLKIQSAEMEEMTKVLDEFNRIADEDGMEEALKAMEGLMNPKRTLNADGGRVGMLSGGLAKGIMQAVKAAKKGYKPFGEKQTYKQNVKKVGLANEEALVRNFERESIGAKEEKLFDIYEDIATGKRYDMVSESTKKDMLAALEQRMREVNVDGGDFQNFMMYLTPKIKSFDIIPNSTKSGIISDSKAGLSYRDNVVPFKPREKKFKGGLAGLLKLIGPQLEKTMTTQKGVARAQRSDAIGDMEQIKNIIRDEGTDLTRRIDTPAGSKTIDELEQMIQDSPRYSDKEKNIFYNLIDYEKFRADTIYNSSKIQKALAEDPEGTEQFLKDLYKLKGSDSGFNMGGRVGFKDGDKVDTMFEPRYDSSSGEYDIKGGAKVGPFDISVGSRGNENYNMDPIMEYEAGLDLPNDFRLTGGYYDDAIMEDGMMSPEDQIRLQIEKRFNKGGLVPPKKGPVSDGMGSLFRRK